MNPILPKGRFWEFMGKIGMWQMISRIRALNRPETLGFVARSVKKHWLSLSGVGNNGWSAMLLNILYLGIDFNKDTNCAIYS